MNQRKIMKPSDKAAEYFHGKEKYNCAQAVLKAFCDKYDISEKDIDSFQGYGGGRAPEGLCGALYAICYMRPDLAPKLQKEFEKIVGAIHCRTIRRDNTTPCRECVRLAAELLARL